MKPVFVCNVSSSRQTKPAESVTIEKSGGDTCPDGMVQTYKGCQEISMAEAEATTAAAGQGLWRKPLAIAALAQAKAAEVSESETETGVDTAACQRLRLLR